MQLEIVQRCVVQYRVMWDADWNCDSDTADVLHKRYTHRTVSDASPVAGTLESAIGFVSDGPIPRPKISPWATGAPYSSDE